ncbi:efflux RND transporter periplasmic adaptor subunit [bacterium]|nr:efflux RND transporter periplasmic adaptor subunit [bacterium]
MTRKKQIIYAVSAFGILFLCLAGIKGCQIAQIMSQRFGPPPEAITTMKAREEVWNDSLQASGSVSPLRGALLSVEEAGTVKAVHITSGQIVEAGTLIAELDTAVEEADLKSAQAKSTWARRNFLRAQELFNRKAFSESDYETAKEQLASANANEEALAARIARKRIIAPFRGELGIIQVTIGQYLTAGTAVVPLFDRSQVFIDFSLPQAYSSILTTGLEITVTTEALQNQSFRAQVSTVNPQVDQHTRNIGVRALLNNAEGLIRPGMFVSIELKLPQVTKVIPLPVTSINYAPFGDTVFIVSKMKNEKGEEYTGVNPQVVRLGKQRGDQVAILSGLKPGDEVATSGVFKLRPAAQVTINNEVAPANSLTPTPANS